MTGTTMVVAIVFISVGFSVLYDMYKKHLAFKERTLKFNAKTSEENNLLVQQVNALTARVETLEKIVTDEGYSIKKEINNL